MAKGRAIAILPADAEKRELTAMTRKQGASQALAERAHIILVAASGHGIERGGADHPERAPARSPHAVGATGRRRLLRGPSGAGPNRKGRHGSRHGRRARAWNEPRDVSAEKKGYDIESGDPRYRHLRFIEVKGRHKEARDVIVTKNEILASLNAPDAFFLALVRVENGFAHRPVYVQRQTHWSPFFWTTWIICSCPRISTTGHAFYRTLT
jgi:hypothetical protein